MQKESSSVDNTAKTNSTNSSSSFPTCKPNLSPPSVNQSDFTSFYGHHPSPMFPPTSTTSLSLTPSDCSFDDNNNNDVVSTTDSRLHQARFVLEYQQLYNRYAICLAHLQDSLKELDSLHDENDSLRVSNSDLVNRLSLLSQATIQNCLLSNTSHPPLSFINDFNRINIGGGNAAIRENREEISNISPTSVIEHNRFDRRGGPERIQLPKSISVRSSGYLKTAAQRAGGNGDPSRGNRVKSPILNESQRVYVPGGKREEEALEFDVYNQGMFKTELCNKWQDTGKCPYGDNCQFAHGITELRPVIRHPRYKTEVCRMVLAGDMCPYGHRCHFRHSLTEQERLLGPLRLNELNG